VADEYLRRIALRHGLSTPAAGRKGYDSLIELTRKSIRFRSCRRSLPLFNEVHALTVAVGKAHCGRTPDCADCPLASDLRFTKSAATGHSKQSDLRIWRIKSDALGTGFPADFSG